MAKLPHHGEREEVTMVGPWWDHGGTLTSSLSQVGASGGFEQSDNVIWFVA